LAEPQSPPARGRQQQQQQQLPKPHQRPASTGRIGLHSRTLKERQELGVPLTPRQAADLRTAAAASQVLVGEAGGKIMQRMLGEDLLAMAMEDMSNSIKIRSKSPEKVPAGIQRLYDDARLKQERMAETIKVTKEAEVKARSRSAPRWVEPVQACHLHRLATIMCHL
jgi:DNA-binding XRE family transcriptional regulator